MLPGEADGPPACERETGEGPGIEGEAGQRLWPAGVLPREKGDPPPSSMPAHIHTHTMTLLVNHSPMLLTKSKSLPVLWWTTP